MPNVARNAKMKIIDCITLWTSFYNILIIGAFGLVWLRKKTQIRFVRI
jgi:hypothetical protein